MPQLTVGEKAPNWTLLNDKDEEGMKMDDNVWNDRDADDFLRYVKADYYVFNQILSIMLMEFVIGFTDFSEVNTMGPRDTWPILYMFGMVIASRAFMLLVKVFKMMEGN